MIKTYSKSVSSSVTTSRSFQQAIFLFCGVGAALSAATANPLVTAAGLLLPAVLFSLLWRSGHPAVLLFAIGFQWMQVITPVLSANVEGVTLTQQFGGPELELAAWYSLGSLLALALGVAIVRHYSGQSLSPQVLKVQSAQLDLNRLFIAYFVLTIASAAITYVGSRAGGLRQPILAFASIKWMPIFLLGWTTLQHRRPTGRLWIVVAIEIVVGLTGFFSTFKSILFMMIVIGIGTTIDERRIRIGQILIYGALTLFLAAFWQSIKTDYRAYLNQGSGYQIVVVPVADRLTYLARASLNVTPEAMSEGIAEGLLRLGYIEYFAHCIRNVPSRIPHENGALWGDAVAHTIMPRILFPNKRVVNISERTNRFTGLGVAGYDQGTSISIGYPGESYIDFGPIGMYVPIFLLGCIYSWIYEQFSRRKPYELAGVSLASSLLVFTANQLEATNVNLFGGLITGMIAFWAIHKWVVPRMWPWLCGGNFR